MERLKKYFKLAAFIPAIVLVGAFVGCRTGMFSRPELKPEPQPTATPQTPTNPPPNPPATEKPPAFIGGSKSPGTNILK